VIGEGGIHTVTVGLAKGTLGVRLPNGMGMLRDNLLGLGLLAGAGGLGGLGLAGMHTTVWGTHQCTITAWRTLTCDPLARLFTGRAEGGDFLTKQGNFGEEGLHGCLVWFWEGGEGDLGGLTTQGHQSGFSVIVSIIFYRDTKMFEHVWIEFGVDCTFPFCESRFKIFVTVNNSVTSFKKV